LPLENVSLGVEAARISSGVASRDSLVSVTPAASGRMEAFNGCPERPVFARAASALAGTGAVAGNADASAYAFPG